LLAIVLFLHPLGAFRFPRGIAGGTPTSDGTTMYPRTKG
jgi:hypothetical protein